MPSGGRIDVSAVRSDRGGIAIFFSDTGIGMAPEEIRRVGQPFIQVDSDLNRRYEGAGLGLAITKGLIALHDGQLVLESTPGKGTSASIQLLPARVLADSIVSAAN